MIFNKEVAEAKNYKISRKEASPFTPTKGQLISGKNFPHELYRYSVLGESRFSIVEGEAQCLIIQYWLLMDVDSLQRLQNGKSSGMRHQFSCRLPSH